MFRVKEIIWSFHLKGDKPVILRIYFIPNTPGKNIEQEQIKTLSQI